MIDKLISADEESTHKHAHAIYTFTTQQPTLLLLVLPERMTASALHTALCACTEHNTADMRLRCLIEPRAVPVADAATTRQAESQPANRTRADASAHAHTTCSAARRLDTTGRPQGAAITSRHV